MFSYSTGYYVSPPDDQYLKFKNRCSLIHTQVTQMCRPSASVELYKKIAQGYFLYESIHRDIEV